MLCCSKKRQTGPESWNWQTVEQQRRIRGWQMRTYYIDCSNVLDWLEDTAGEIDAVGWCIRQNVLHCVYLKGYEGLCVCLCKCVSCSRILCVRWRPGKEPRIKGTTTGAMLLSPRHIDTYTHTHTHREINTRKHIHTSCCIHKSVS